MAVGEAESSLEENVSAVGSALDVARLSTIGGASVRTRGVERRHDGDESSIVPLVPEQVLMAVQPRDAPFNTCHMSNVKRPSVGDAVDEENLPLGTVTVADPDTLCGLGSWHPAWLQRLASKKTYVLVHGLIGLTISGFGYYLVATLSTIEKRFKIPSKTSGVVASAWEIGTCFSLLFLSYLGTNHKPRFVAMGTLLVGVGCLTRLLPHIIYGPGQDALLLTKEYGASSEIVGNVTKGGGLGTLCGASETGENENCSDTGSFSASAIILFVANLLVGVGSSVYWTLGVSYLDDNTRKDKAPLVLAAAQAVRMFGPTVGFSFGAYALARYVDPNLTPVIDQSDPRWIGAWWLGLGPAAAMCLIFAACMSLFPRELPRAAERRRQTGAPPKPQRNHSLTDFRVTFARLLKNRILVFNTLSGVCFIIGYIGYWTYMPKYMETQFRQSASQASFISGSVTLVFMGLGVVTSAAVIAKFKPRARTLAAWSVFVEIIDVLGHFSWAFLSCGERDLHGDWASDHTWNLTAPCNAGCDCGVEVKYSPVCSMDGATTFYSPCHAGCSDSLSSLNGTVMYSGCACAPGGVVAQGSCPRDCSFNFTLFIVSQCIMRFLGMFGKAGNTLIHFRCIDEEDKPLAIGLSEFLISALAFIPGPIIYGMILDSACLVWGQTCSRSGNCWLYEGDELRYRLNFTAAVCLFCGMVLDVVVWYYCKNLQIYDEDDAKKRENNLSKSGRADMAEKPFLEET